MEKSIKKNIATVKTMSTGTDIDTNTTIEEKTDRAFHIACMKTEIQERQPELILQTGEAFGKGLFTDHIQQQENKEWTIHEWAEITQKRVLLPMKSNLVFTTVQEDEAQSVMFTPPLSLHQNTAQASLFTYGLLRGLFRSAFPHGELSMTAHQTGGTKVTELKFKLHATSPDKYERDKIKKLLELEK